MIRGLVILAGFDVFGGISAGITIEGSVFVENGGETGIIPRYRINPDEFVTHTPGPICIETPLAIKETTKVPPISNQNPGVYPRRTIDAIILDMEDALQNDKNLNDSTVSDALADLTALKAQLLRTKTNSEVIKALVFNLSAIPSIQCLAHALSLILESNVRSRQ